jgi:hypothetical protein
MIRLFAGAAMVLVTCAEGAVAQSPTPATAYTDTEFRYSVSLPTACRHVDGPGTREAICALDLDAEQSKEVAAAGAFVLEVDAEAVPAGAPAYSEADFRKDLPESVCGGEDAGRVAIGNVARRAYGGGEEFTADVVCPGIRFLQLPQRKARVRYVLLPGLRYRLMARAPDTTLDTLRPVANAFFASFKTAMDQAPEKAP